MKKIFLLFLFLFLLSPCSLGEEDNTYLTGRIESADFLKNASSFVLAIIEGNDKEVERLLKLGANPNEKYSAIPVIYFASHQKYDNIVRLLLEYGANPNTTFLKENILKYSIFRKCTGCVSNLIEYGADVNKKTFGCSTPLDFALQLKDVQSAQMLLKAGANPTKKNTKTYEKT